MEPSDKSTEHLKVLALGPLREVMSHKGYYVNGYKFHTREHGKNRVTSNSGVCVKGSCYNDYECDYYGVLDEVLEVHYPSIVRCVVVLFKCNWFDAFQGVRVDKHGLVDVKHRSMLSTDDPFVLASQATQVFYAPYPSMTKDLKAWWAVVKTKPRSIYEVAQCVDEVADEDNVEGEQFFQETERVTCPPSTSTHIDPDSLVTPGAFIEIVLNIEPENEEESENEEEFEEEEEFEDASDEENDDDLILFDHSDDE